MPHRRSSSALSRPPRQPAPEAGRLSDKGPLRGPFPHPHLMTGFTLVELVMVIMILGILSISFAPRVASLSAYDARTWADDLRQALRHARSLAVQRGCAVRVDVGSGGYALWNDARCHQSGAPDFSLAVLSTLDREPMARALPDSLELEPVSLVFQADGAVLVSGRSPDSLVAIAIGEQRIRLWPSSGRIQ